MTATQKPPRRPLLLWLSVAATVLIFPLLWLLERMSGYCGDGLCTFTYGVLTIAGCLLPALVLAVSGWIRGERPRWIPLLALLPLAGLARLVGVF